MWTWVKAHPQRTASFLLIVFTQIQASLALANFTIPPIWTWGINTFFGVVMAVLAFVVKHTKDDSDPGKPAI